MAPKQLLRYEQIRRRGKPDVQETDAPFGGSEYFDANCLATDDLLHCVYVVSNTAGAPDVTTASPLLGATMPVVGLIVHKPTPLTCLVQVDGPIATFSTLVPGSTYYVGLDGAPTTVAPAWPAIQQSLGVCLTPTTLMLSIQGALKSSNYDFLLDCDPDAAANTNSLTRVAGQVTNETWVNNLTLKTVKSIDYARTADGIASEVVKVYADDGLVVAAQKTVSYTRTGGSVTSISTVRDV